MQRSSPAERFPAGLLVASCCVIRFGNPLVVGSKICDEPTLHSKTIKGKCRIGSSIENSEDVRRLQCNPVKMFWGTVADCPVHEECLEWAHTYLKDCVCSFRDELSLALGLLSVVSWGVAEVPQIITNFRERSTEGVSLAFLMTWVVGDAFNLAGCYLEPATLPTQFYMAILYTLTTLILVVQTIYYDYFYIWYNWKMGYAEVEYPKEKEKVEVIAVKPMEKPSKPAAPPTEPEVSPEATPISVSVPLTRRTSLRASDLYYTSARSLASSHTPGIGSYIVGSRDRESGSYDAHHGFLRSTFASSPQHAHGSGNHHEFLRSTLGSPPTHGSAQSGSLLRTAAGSVLLVGSVGLTTTLLGGSSKSMSTGNYPATQFLLMGRRLLQQISVPRSKYSFSLPTRSFLGEAVAEGPLGEIFGWCMATIYMGGRLPQILLNIKRGTVEGLNPLMFVFALVGNATYVGSILVRSVLWVNIKPNLPWLVDAGVCVLLDLFILCQFIYYNLEVMAEVSESDYQVQKESQKESEKK